MGRSCLKVPGDSQLCSQGTASMRVKGIQMVSVLSLFVFQLRSQPVRTEASHPAVP